MAELSDEQRKNFEDRLRELGMDPSHVVPELHTNATPGPTYLSNHPDFESEIEPRTLTIEDVDHLKQVAGIPDEEYDDGKIPHHHEPLEEWPAGKNDHAAADLEPEENDRLRDALVHHVYGHSEKVATYREVLNNQFFPMEAAVWAVLDVTVYPGHPLILTGNNQGHDFGIVTIKPGGQIIFESDATMTCQKMVME